MIEVYDLLFREPDAAAGRTVALAKFDAPSVVVGIRVDVRTGWMWGAARLSVGTPDDPARYGDLPLTSGGRFDLTMKGSLWDRADEIVAHVSGGSFPEGSGSVCVELTVAHPIAVEADYPS